MKRSISDGDWSSLKKKAKLEDDEDLGFYFGSQSGPVNPPPIRCSIGDGDIFSRTKTDTHQDALCLESAMVNPQSMRSSIRGNRQDTRRVFHIVFDRPEPDPKFYLDKAWGLLKPAITNIFLEEPHCFSCAAIFKAVHGAWMTKSSGEALFKLILDEIGTYISTDIQSLIRHCNDDDPSVFVRLLEKTWLKFRPKIQFLCSFAGAEGQIGWRNLYQLGLEVFSTHLFLASDVCDKVLSIILVMIKDQRLGKSVNTRQLENLMNMLQGDSFRKSRFLEKPFLDCAAEFYAAEGTQVLEQSDIHQYLKYVERRLGEEKEKCRNHCFFCCYEDELIEIVNRELLGVHACAIIEKGFDKLMDERDGEGLHRMYNLFSEAELVSHINDALCSYIWKTGEKILRDGSSMAEFKAQVDKICTSEFFEDCLLEKTVKKCFEGLGLPCKDPFTVEAQGVVRQT